MKIIKKQSEKTELSETKFHRNAAFDYHFNKHVAQDWPIYFLERDYELLPPMTKDEYDNDADLLTKQSVRTSDIDAVDRYVGFVTKSGRIVKYDKNLRELVIYVSNSVEACTVTYYQCNGDTHARYRRLLDREYEREITPEDDKYNV